MWVLSLNSGENHGHLAVYLFKLFDMANVGFSLGGEVLRPANHRVFEVRYLYT